MRSAGVRNRWKVVPHAENANVSPGPCCSTAVPQPLPTANAPYHCACSPDVPQMLRVDGVCLRAGVGGHEHVPAAGYASRNARPKLPSPSPIPQPREAANPPSPPSSRSLHFPDCRPTAFVTGSGQSGPVLVVVGPGRRGLPWRACTGMWCWWCIAGAGVGGRQVCIGAGGGGGGARSG